MGLSRHSKSLTGLRSRYLVRGLRLAVSTASRPFAVSLVVTEVMTPSFGLDSLQGSPSHDPWNPARFQWPSWGFFPCFGIRSAQQFPGFQLWSLRCRIEIPQTACFIELSDPKIGTKTGWGCPSERFPRAEPKTLRSPALMPFLTSSPSALRTRGSRCPAASGLYSLRGSVPCARPKSGAGRCSHGLFRLVRSWFRASG